MSLVSVDSYPLGDVSALWTFSCFCVLTKCLNGPLHMLILLPSPISISPPQVMGFRVHTRYAAWLELVLISMVVPNASFLGHLCGILAGILYVEVPIVLRLVNLLTGATLLNGHQRPSYTYSSGTSAATPASGRGNTNGQGGTTTARRNPAARQQSPQPTVYDVDADDDGEEAALQEALRRSLLDSNGGGGGSSGSSAGLQGGLGRDDAAAASAILGAPPPMPTAPPLGEDSGGMGRDELRRRRLQRLGGDL